ncbi:hypothetical protein YC2023_033780 [Brassica napus]
MQPACAQVSAKSILTGALKPKIHPFSTLAHQYAWPRSYQGKMLTLRKNVNTWLDDGPA